MLHHLPVEIALQTISYLPLHSLRSTTLTSREWNALIASNEPTVYRNAAILHRFIDEERFSTDPNPIDWMAFCRRQLEIERGWRGKAPSAVRELTATGTMVHRIKVDHELGFVITTFKTGGLSVCDIKSNRVLWSLPSFYAVRYAHLEYDRGYIVFNRHDNCKEVWRHTIDTDADWNPEASPPDKKMLDASTQAALTYGSAESHRGHFKAWALLRLPEISRAFRLSYPTMLAVATHNAYLWDVATAQLISVIRDTQRLDHNIQLAAINYVEVNDKYVFICDSGRLRIFAREGGELLYQLWTRELSSATWDILPQSPGLASSVVQPQMLIHNHHSPSSFHGGFMACHVAVSGNDLAALTTNGRLVLLPGFQRLFTGSNTVHHRDTAIILNFQFQPFASHEDFSCYLAVGGRNGKLAVATRKGIFVISPDFDFTRLTADCPPEPGVSVCRLSKFEDDHLLSLISCLQITHDAIYFTYKRSQLGGSSDTAHRAEAHGTGAHFPPDEDVLPDILDIMEDEPADGWEDEDFEDAEAIDGGGDDDAVHALINHWFLPTAPNTVYSVSF